MFNQHHLMNEYAMNWFSHHVNVNEYILNINWKIDGGMS